MPPPEPGKFMFEVMEMWQSDGFAKNLEMVVWTLRLMWLT
jgi:hypothetical protein